MVLIVGFNVGLDVGFDVGLDVGLGATWNVVDGIKGCVGNGVMVESKAWFTQERVSE